MALAFAQANPNKCAGLVVVAIIAPALVCSLQRRKGRQEGSGAAREGRSKGEEKLQRTRETKLKPRGDKKKNIILSQNRAIAVKDYLIMNKIDQNRLIAKGFGSLKPVYNDDEIEKMKFENREKAHQANRRTEYKIIK